ncbi:MAG: hypothetical protein DJ555_06580 [Desulfurococcaceae archaeon]|nr:MAG: hypothetical protein DJ555_06580 [Desulfurococcaceae archaeon]
MPIGKRELASYLLLYSSGKEVISIDHAREILELILPRRAVRSVIRILAKSGFIDLNNKEIRIHKPEEAMGNYLSQYIKSRIERNAKSKHIHYRIERGWNNIEKIYIDSVKCGEKINIGGRIEIICKTNTKEQLG